MTSYEEILHDLTQRFFRATNEAEKKTLYNRMERYHKKICEDNIPRTGWWLVNPNPGPNLGIPPGSIYLGTKLTLNIDKSVNDIEHILPSNHSAVIYWGRRQAGGMMTFKDGEFTFWTSEIYEDSTSTINVIFRVRANTIAAIEARKRELSIIGLRQASPDEISVWIDEHPNLKPIP